MKYQFVLLLCVVVNLVPLTCSYNILVLYPYPGKSHFISFVKLFRALAEKGHDVTVVSHYPLNEKILNYRDVEIGGLHDIFKNDLHNLEDLSKTPVTSRFTMYLTPWKLFELGQLTCETAFSSKAFQNFIRENNHYDIAILEFFNTDCFLTPLKKYSIPVVRVHSSSLMPWTSYRYGNPTTPSYIPHHFSDFSDKMNFIQRVENLLLNFVVSNLYNNWYVLHSDIKLSTKYFGDAAASIPSDVFRDSILLLNTHFTVNLPRPLVPNIIEIGGIHLGKSESLPKV